MSKTGGLVVRRYRHGRSYHTGRERAEDHLDEVGEEEEDEKEGLSIELLCEFPVYFCTLQLLDEFDASCLARLM